MPNVHIAQIELSTAALLLALHFPPVTEVVAVNGDNAPLGSIWLWVSHPELPAVEEGQPIPTAQPVITAPMHLGEYRVEYDFNWGMAPGLIKETDHDRY